MGYMVLAGLSFTFLDTTAKYLSNDLPVLFVVWARYGVHCLLMLLVLAPSRGWDLVRAGRPMLQVVRGLMLLVTTASGMAALSHLPIAETLAIAFLAPLIVVLAAAPLLKEKPSRLTILAVLCGFAGTLLIVRPGGAVVGVGVAFALCTAIAYAAYQLLTRHLCQDAGSITLLFYTALTGTLGASLAVPFFWPQISLTLTQWVLLISLGLYGGAGHFLLIRAFALADASTLSPLLYSQLIWQTLAGAWVFNHVPDAWAILGGLMIVGSGLMVVWSQKKHAQKS
jgi:drug/metabolite transporter (DMT)-like permease